jgi:conjugal transfer pilus assembly protein TraD
VSFKPAVTDLFRPITEFRVAAGWLLAAFACLVVAVATSIYVHLFWLIPCFLYAFVWVRRAVYVFAFRAQLHAPRLMVLPIEQMRSICVLGQDPLRAPFEFSQGRVNTPAWWLGSGFEWQPGHATLALELGTTDNLESRLLPQWAVRPAWTVQRWYKDSADQNTALYRALSPTVDSISASLYPGTIKDRSPIGQSWIHALEPTKIAILYIESAMAGHTFIVGAPGSGKTRLNEVLSTQAIHGNNVGIVMDPKFDEDWERRCRLECAKKGKKYLYFNLARLSKSIRLNPLSNWNNPSEIASRIVGILPHDKGGASFVNFAHLSIDRAVKGLLFCGEQPSLRKIQSIIERGVGPLLQSTLERVFSQAMGSEWRVNLEAQLAGGMSDGAPGANKKGPKSGDVLSAMVSLYLTDPRLAEFRCEPINGLLAGVVAYDSYSEQERTLDPGAAKLASEAIAGLISTFEHNKEHYGKMILVLLPKLNMLCSGEIGDSLSPDPTADDPREIWDISRIVNEDAFLYLGLNTLADREVGEALGSMFLAGCVAVIGQTYETIPDAKARKQVCLFIDEAHQVVSEQMITVLNQGRGAGWRVFASTQTLADFEAKMGSAALADKILGNFNNFICLRVQNMKTRQYMSELFGETRVFEQSVSSTQGTESDATALEFRGSVSYSNKKTKSMKVHPDLLGRLSNMHYFASIQGGTIYKGQVPILID